MCVCLMLCFAFDLDFQLSEINSWRQLVIFQMAIPMSAMLAFALIVWRENEGNGMKRMYIFDCICMYLILYLNEVSLNLIELV